MRNWNQGTNVVESNREALEAGFFGDFLSSIGIQSESYGLVAYLRKPASEGLSPALHDCLHLLSVRERWICFYRAGEVAGS